jgi:ubiquitin carboxyl-terminal hydrolase 14
MEIEKERMERGKIRKRTKNKASTSQTTAPPDSASSTEGAVMDVDKKPEEGGDLEDEPVYRKKELEELDGLISPDVKADVGASPTGLYELIGTCESSCMISGPYDEWTAIITHKGAAADAGHYIGFVKKSAFHPKASQATGLDQKTIDDDDDDWYKFDDEKVSIFPVEKLSSLDGGGSYLPLIVIGGPPAFGSLGTVSLTFDLLFL